MAFAVQSVVLTRSSVATINTASWSGLGRRLPIPAFIRVPIVAYKSRAGARILSQGQYQATFTFSAQVDATTTGIQIRGQNASGPTRVVNYSAPDAGDIINGVYSFLSNVSTNDLTTDDVYVYVEAASLAGTEDITWIQADLIIRRIGRAK